MENNAQTAGSNAQTASSNTQTAGSMTVNRWLFCPHCSKGLAPDWNHCPGCGALIALSIRYFSSYPPQNPPQQWIYNPAYSPFQST